LGISNGPLGSGIKIPYIIYKYIAAVFAHLKFESTMNPDLQSRKYQNCRQVALLCALFCARWPQCDYYY